jgi:high-affinity nickel-transport protein
MVLATSATTTADGTIFGWGTGFLALTLGMRHAFDADHISAIGNTTHQVVAGRNPTPHGGIGFFFSLGPPRSSPHWVLRSNFRIDMGVQVKNGRSSLHHYTSLIGTTVSGSFLVLIAVLNLVDSDPVSLKSLWKCEKACPRAKPNLRSNSTRGFMMRFFGPISKTARIDKSWKMYQWALLFGLRFDTQRKLPLY